MRLLSYLILQGLGTLTPSAQPPEHLPVPFSGFGRVCFILILITRLLHAGIIWSFIYIRSFIFAT